MTFSYRNLQNEDVKEVQKFLEEHYLNTHPLAVYKGISVDDFKDTHFARSEHFYSPFNKHFMIKQGNSFGAFYTGKLCGLVMGFKPDKDEIKSYKSRISGNEEIQIRMYHTMHGGKEAEVVGTDNYWEATNSCVAPKFRALGPQRELFKRLNNEARRKGVKKIVSYFVRDDVRDDKNSKIIRRIHLPDYVDPVTGKKEYAGMKPPICWANMLSTSVKSNGELPDKMKAKL